LDKWAAIIISPLAREAPGGVDKRSIKKARSTRKKRGTIYKKNGPRERNETSEAEEGEEIMKN